MTNPRIAELEWYRKFGRYPERIRKDSLGLDYMIGDYAWHRKHPDRQEFVEERMRHEGVYGEQP